MVAAAGARKKAVRENSFLYLGFMPAFVRHAQFFSSFGPSSGQNCSTVGGRHPLSETVFVSSFSIRWLKCPFHGDYLKLLYTC
jgi:hypothetical protein